MSAGVAEQPGFDELAHPLLAEALDVHRAAAGAVHEPLLALRRAVDVDAVVVGLALEPHERLRRRPGTSFGNFQRRAPRLPLREHRPDDLGDHVAGLAHDHRVAGPHVLARDLVLVVQRRQPDGGAADEHRLEHRERRRAPGAPDAHHDVAQERRLLLGRELVGDRPAGRLLVNPISARWPRSSTFTTTPSIS